MDHQLQTRAGALRLALGLTAALAGLDKFFNLLANWSTYVSPIAASLLPVSPETFMYAVGVVECAVGVAILGVAPALGAYAASAWLLLVAANLLLGGYVDIAIRDVVMSVAAVTLARLLELRSRATSPAPARDVTARRVTAA